MVQDRMGDCPRCLTEQTLVGPMDESRQPVDVQTCHVCVYFALFMERSEYSCGEEVQLFADVAMPFVVKYVTMK